jgi:ABC-2 type transport system permease protein
MTPVLALFGASVRQLLPLRRSILLALLQLGPALIYLIGSSGRTTEAALDAFLDGGAATYFILVLPVVSMVLASSALGVERRDQTLSFIVLRPMRRSVIVMTKFAATVTAAMALNAVGAIALSGIQLIRFGGDLDLMFGLLTGALIATIAYAAIFIPVGFLTDRAVIIGLAFLLIFENGVVNALPALETLSPWRLGVAAFADIAGVSNDGLEESLRSLSYSAGRSLTVVAVMAAVSVAVTTLLMSRRDLA